MVQFFIAISSLISHNLTIYYYPILLVRKTTRKFKFTQLTGSLNKSSFPSSYFFTLPNINHESADHIYNILPYSTVRDTNAGFSTPENENGGFSLPQLGSCFC